MNGVESEMSLKLISKVAPNGGVISQRIGNDPQLKARISNAAGKLLGSDDETRMFRSGALHLNMAFDFASCAAEIITTTVSLHRFNLPALIH